MKKKIIITLVTVALLSVSLSAFAMGIRCPRCRVGNCWWNGNYVTDAWGIHHEYQCINGHRFYVD